MIPMNRFITDNQEKMNDFLSRIAVAAQNVASEGNSELVTYSLYKATNTSLAVDI